MHDERTEPVDTYRTNALHPGCRGALVHDGSAPRIPRTPLGNGAAEYRHACNTCGANVWLPTAYPLITYKSQSIPDAPPTTEVKAAGK